MYKLQSSRHLRASVNESTFNTLSSKFGAFSNATIPIFQPLAALQHERCLPFVFLLIAVILFTTRSSNKSSLNHTILCLPYYLLTFLRFSSSYLTPNLTSPTFLPTFFFFFQGCSKCLFCSPCRIRSRRRQGQTQGRRTTSQYIALRDSFCG